MTDEPIASEETHAMVRRILEDRQLGEHIVPRFMEHGLSHDMAEFIILHELMHRACLAHQVSSPDLELYNVTDGLLDPQAIIVSERATPNPSWQDRRNQSLEAKRLLVAKLKARNSG